MSDLYGSNESEDMSSFLQILLQNSSSSAATTSDSATAAGVLFRGAGVLTESSTSFNLSDPNCFFAGESARMNPFSRVKNREVPEVCDVPSDPTPRVRRKEAEMRKFIICVKRRSRINEKIKALQTLIPNSNKTDKASMLDEAIDYLKQLQLEVQMLAMRNGVSLLPGYSVGSLQSTLAGNAPQTANSPNTPSRDPNVYMQNFLVPTNHNASTLPMLVPSTRNTNSNSGVLPSFVPSMEHHYGFPNHLDFSKDVCRDDTLPRLHLDISCTGNTSSPGISS